MITLQVLLILCINYRLFLPLQAICIQGFIWDLRSLVEGKNLEMYWDSEIYSHVYIRPSAECG